jgi:hypothetical protein
MPKLYHKAVYAPEVFFRSPGLVRLRYSAHALEEAALDRYGDLTQYLADRMNFDDAEIVEVELDDEGQISKRVARFKVAANLVIVMAVSVDGYVKTVWGNRPSDKHKTLKQKKYVQRPPLVPRPLQHTATVDTASV